MRESEFYFIAESKVLAASNPKRRAAALSGRDVLVNLQVRTVGPAPLPAPPAAAHVCELQLVLRSFHEIRWEGGRGRE